MVVCSVTEWLPIRKLKLSTGSYQSQENLTDESPVDFSAPDPFLAATSLNPFSERLVTVIHTIYLEP